FFFQAEDGIRDKLVTGVQTCALPIYGRRFAPFPVGKYHPLKILGAGGFGVAYLCKHKYLDAPVVVKAFASDYLDRPVEEVFAERSEERRVGKECRCRWEPDK